MIEAQILPGSVFREKRCATRMPPITLFQPFKGTVSIAEACVDRRHQNGVNVRPQRQRVEIFNNSPDRITYCAFSRAAR